MRKLLLVLLMACALPLTADAQQKKAVDAALKTWLRNYEPTDCKRGARCRLERSVLDVNNRTLRVYANAAFGEQPFRPEKNEQIVSSLKSALPAPVNKYKVIIYVGDRTIDDLCLNSTRRKPDATRRWQKGEDYRGRPWVTDESRPYAVTRGLQGRHLAVNASHGYFYKNAEDSWKWQRPPVFGTREDLLTPSFVYPYLIPMLENAGAVVYTTRERDPQPHEVLIDNDTHDRELGLYYEEHHGSSPAWRDLPSGFSTPDSALRHRQNPFSEGSARIVTTTSDRRSLSAAVWQPVIPEAGEYAVYVSYQTLPESVDDAHYIVVHSGGTTRFTVNQQMGGGTWVYLGTFSFDAGIGERALVALTNESGSRGVVTADAVRFGGGMGNVLRGPEGAAADSMHVSGMPRYYEGSRYSAQWRGFPYHTYANYDSTNDYAEDINCRSYTCNYLAGGSVYLPDSVGLGVPLELVFGLHTDAGIDDEGVVGTLGICTTAFHDGQLGDGRLSRYASRDLVDEVMTGLMRDFTAAGYTDWTRRGIWDRNYSESRLPEVPSMILELLAHQNFNDMRYAHDPAFKFTACRSIYKSLMRYVYFMHDLGAPVVQPLPVAAFAATLRSPQTVHLSWQPVVDPQEPTAKPTDYVVYVRRQGEAFDGGRLVHGTEADIDIDADVLYSFRVTAVNAGGQSFPSVTLTAGTSSAGQGSVLLQTHPAALTGPAVVDDGNRLGFDLTHPGTPYIATRAYCGYQQNYDRGEMALGPDACLLGESDDTLIGTVVSDDAYEAVVRRAAELLQQGVSVSSATYEAVRSGAVAVDRYGEVTPIISN